jgi:hypothetical protein
VHSKGNKRPPAHIHGFLSVNIKNPESRRRSRCNADVRLRPPVPPLFDLRLIERGILPPMFCPRVLPRRHLAKIASGSTRTSSTLFNVVQGKHFPTPLSIREAHLLAVNGSPYLSTMVNPAALRTSVSVLTAHPRSRLTGRSFLLPRTCQQVATRDLWSSSTRTQLNDPLGGTRKLLVLLSEKSVVLLRHPSRATC